MSKLTLPLFKAKSSQRWTVYWFSLAKEPVGDLHGFVGVLGTYEEEEDAINAAKKARLATNFPCRMRVCKTGLADRLLGDDAAYQKDTIRVTADENHILHQKYQEEKERIQREREEMETRKRELELEQTPQDDPTSYESYASLQVKYELLKSMIGNQEVELSKLKEAQVKLTEEVRLRSESYPEYLQKWESLPQ